FVAGKGGKGKCECYGGGETYGGKFGFDCYSGCYSNGEEDVTVGSLGV
nr:hypothetical protein [Tanacetum cinerariifolium]